MFKTRVTKRTCVQRQLELLNFVCGPRFSVNSFRVKAVHLDVVDQLLHDQGNGPLIAGQARDFHSELPGGELWIKLLQDGKQQKKCIQIFK